MPKTVDIVNMINPDNLATNIADKMVTWANARVNWENNCRETIQYLYATSTADIMNIPRIWDNTTHLPKLTQVRDLLLTLYHEAIFSLPDFVEWEPYSKDTLVSEVKNSLRSFTRQMLDDSGFKDTVDALLEDYIDYGNCFAMPVYCRDVYHGTQGQNETIFEGPKLVRINPMDIYFDPSVAEFSKAPKIIRSIVTIGELKAMTEDMPEDETFKKAFDRAVKKRLDIRREVSGMGSEQLKNDELQIAGFSTLSAYYNSDVVELLTFYGDMYDMINDKMYRNHKIVVMDRSVVLTKEPVLNLGQGCNIIKAGWRDRKDTAWSMSPLDNIKGMQYMIDFLENKRADIFNYISNPITVTIGDVEMPEQLAPATEIHCDRDASVTQLRPDTTALQADTYIDKYMYLMEEMAGAPREAAGFRTPGEKTAFEVAQLNTAASRVFNKQTRKFEKEMLEPAINLMLQMFLVKGSGRTVRVKMVDPDGYIHFEDINVDDLDGAGKFVAVGSSTFTEKDKMAQTLMQLGNSAVYMDELVRNNFDPKKVAEILAYTTGLDRFNGLLKDNARVDANLEMMSAAESAQQILEEKQSYGLQAAQEGVGVEQAIMNRGM